MNLDERMSLRSQIAYALVLFVVVMITVAAGLTFMRYKNSRGYSISELKPLQLNEFLVQCCEANKIAVVHFYSPTCKYCEEEEKHLANLKNAMFGSVCIGKINISSSPEGSLLVRTLNITGVPTILLYSCGNFLWLTGFTPVPVLKEKIWEFQKSRILDEKSNNWRTRCRIQHLLVGIM